MEAIKKKMQAMKLEKDNAVDRAEQAENTARDANTRAEKVTTWQKSQSIDSNLIFCLFFFWQQAEEEVRALQKKIQQIENELDQVQENLAQANSKLEEKEKALQNVSDTERPSGSFAPLPLDKRSETPPLSVEFILIPIRC